MIRPAAGSCFFYTRNISGDIGEKIPPMPDKDHLAMQGSLMFRRVTDEISDDVIARCKTMKAAIKLSVEVSGLCVKEIAFQLSREEKWVSRVLADNPDDTRHFPPDLIGRLMDICDNEIPLRWLALSRGYGLHKLKSRLEEENEELQRELKAEREKMAAVTEFIKSVKGVA